MTQAMIPPAHTEWDGGDDGDRDLSVYVSIHHPDGTHLSTGIDLDPQASAGTVADAIVKAATGAAAIWGEGLPEQLAMRVVDPDKPASMLATGGLTVTILDQWEADWRRTHGHGVDMLVKVGPDSAVTYKAARALLIMAGAL
jgi:hypothetical protein